MRCPIILITMLVVSGLQGCTITPGAMSATRLAGADQAVHATMTPEQGFWDWSIANQDKLFDWENRQEKILGELGDQLERIDPHLGYEFGPPENGKREFAISADGNKIIFPKVTSLVRAAPMMEKWCVLAFRKPKGSIAAAALGDLAVHANDVYFRAEREGNKIELIIFLPDDLLAHKDAAYNLT